MVLSAVCCGNEIECNTQWWMICITHFVGWDMVVLYLLKLHRQCTVCTHSAHDTSLRVSYISLYSVYSFSILSAHLCILSLHISVHSHLCIFDTISYPPYVDLCILSNREQCCPPKCWSTAWPPSTPASCYWEQTQVLCTCTTGTTGNWNTNWHLWGTVSSACYTSSEPQC